MTRRSFFTSLGLLAAGAAVAPGIFVPKFEPVRWKVAKVKTICIPNPEYDSAPYELRFLLSPGAFRTVGLVPVSDRKLHVIESYPIRYQRVNGENQLVPPFLQLTVPA